MQNGLLWINEKASELSALSKTIWDYAEVGLREEKSAAALADYLEKEGFSTKKGVGNMPSAFVASFGEGKPILGFLGEYDRPVFPRRSAPLEKRLFLEAQAMGAVITCWGWGVSGPPLP
jgi:aminobenzoyl-glutamate utilization protein B